MRWLWVWPFAVVLSGCGNGEYSRPDDSQPQQLQLQDLVRLESSVPGMEPMPGSKVAKDARGRFLVAPVVTPGTIAVFDSAGSFVKSLGRSGDGPGEFREVSAIQQGSADSILVLDSNGRITVVDPELELSRTVQLQARGTISAIAAAGPETVFAATLLMDRSVAERITVVDLESGSVIGEAGGSLPGDTMEANYRSLARDESGTVWAGRGDARELDGLDPSGNLIQRFPLSPGPGPCGQNVAEGTTPPRLLQVGSSASGLIWLMLWQRLPTEPEPAPASGGAIRKLDVSEMQRMNAVWVEGFDPETGQTILCHEFGELVPAGFAGADLVYTLRNDEAGNMKIELYRMQAVVPARN